MVVLGERDPMRTRTTIDVLYTARELKESHPDGFARAYAKFRQHTFEDPAWEEESRQSLAAVLACFPDETPSIDGPTRAYDVRRCMAWVENNIIGPLRIPYVKVSKRKDTMKYGAGYRPGMVKPCPFTGYCWDESLLDFVVRMAREGKSPDDIKRWVSQEAERLWEADVEFQASEESFLDSADANEWEYTESGRMA